MAPAHPEWSGLQAVSSPTPRLEVAGPTEEKQVNPKQPIDYFAQDEKLLRSPGWQAPKFLFSGTGRDSKMVDTPNVTSPTSSGYSSEKQTQYQSQLEVQPSPLPPDLAKKKKSRRRPWIALGLLLFIVAIAIAVPLGVTLGRKSQDTSSSLPNSVPSTLNMTSPQNTQPTTSTPYNGTSLATLEPLGTTDKLWLFWQSANGSIWLSKLNAYNQWVPKINMNITNAVIGTPIACATHKWGGMSQGLNHLAYYTQDRVYADITNDPSKGDIWIDGGLQAQAKPGPYDPRFSMAWGVDATGSGWLYVAGPRSDWINEFPYDATDQRWLETPMYLFKGTYVWGGLSVEQSGNVTQLKTVDSEMNIIPWVRDLGNLTDPHWARINEPLAGTWPNTSLAAPHVGGDPTLLYYQTDKGTIGLAKSSGLNETSTWTGQQNLGIPAMAGSELHVSCVPYNSGLEETTLLFLQETGDDITIYMGNATQLVKNGTLPI